MSLCRFIWVSLGGFLYSNHSPSSMSAMRTMRIRLADVGDINTKIPKRPPEPLQWKSRDVKRDNSERFFSSAARPRASAPRSVSVVAGKQHPLKARSSLASTLLFQSPDSNLVAAAALVQGLRQGPEVGWSLWEVKRDNSVHFIPNWEHDSQVLVHLLSKSKMQITKFWFGYKI